MNGLRFGIVMLFVGLCLADDVFLSTGPQTYSSDYREAFKRCESLGAHLATKDELKSIPMCHCGWTLDGTANFYMNRSDSQCGGGAGLNSCTWRRRWDAYCFRGSVRNCSRPLGLEDGSIRDSQLYSSSEYHTRFPFITKVRWSASIARVNNKNLVNAWMPQFDGRNQWLEIDLEKPTAVTGIVTQGASKTGLRMWVESFVIAYSKDKHHYKTVQVAGSNGGQEKIFEGNSNNDGIKRNMFPEPVLARYVRFIPRDYHNHIALRLELLGCDMETYNMKSVTPTRNYGQ